MEKKREKINIRQLQLDDLALYSGKVCRVTAVRLDNDGKVRAVVENDDFCGFVDEVEPIPLTAEILEKNGCAKDGIFMTFSEDPNTKLAWADRCGACLYKNGHHICDCEHVHTLLHASERILHGNKCDMVVIDPLDDFDKHHLKTIFKFIDEHTTTT